MIILEYIKKKVIFPIIKGSFLIELFIVFSLRNYVYLSSLLFPVVLSKGSKEGKKKAALWLLVLVQIQKSSFLL